MIARALLALAAVLLAVPGAFIAARGVSGLRRGVVVVRGREVGGGRARVVAVALVAYGALMIAIAATIAVQVAGR